MTKYGESAGPLAGLATEPVQSQEEVPDIDYEPHQPDVGEAELTALLDQMAQEGPSQLSEDRLATSVEWGAYGDRADEPPPPPIDDLLTGMGTGEDQAPLYDDQPPGVETEAGDIEIPDWLSDSAPSAHETGPDLEAAEQPEAGTSYDVPDWLSDETSEVAESDLSPDQEADVPDWLLDELDKPAQTAPLQTPPESPVEPASEPPAAPDAELDRSTAESEPSLDSAPPDWLDELPPLDGEDTDVEEPELAGEDVPDWLSDMPTPTADEAGATPGPESSPDDEISADWSVPDWIAAEMTDEEEAELRVASTGEEDQEFPDWLSGEETAGPEDPSRPDIPEWLGLDLDAADEDIDSPAGEPISPPETDWMSDLDALEAEVDSPADEEATPPPGADWLRDMDFPPEQEPADESSSFDVPDWLTDLGASIDEETAEEIVSVEGTPADVAEPDFEGVPETELTLQDEPPFEEPPVPEIDQETPSKLKKLKPLKRLPKKPATPDWVAGLIPPEQPPSGSEEQPPPAWTADLVPSTATQATGPATPSVPNWAEALVPPEYEITAGPAEQQPSEADAPPEERPAVPVSDESELATEPVSEEQPVEEPVDWIAQFSSAPGDVEAPAEEAEWPADDEIGTEEDDSLLSDRLDWLMASDQMEPSPPPPGPGAIDETVEEEVTPEEPEIPDWLEADQAEAAGVEKFSVPSSEQEKTPEWLADSDEASSEAEDTETPYAIEEKETPDWLADLPEVSPDEMPDWLAQPDEAPEEETELPDQVAEASRADEEVEAAVPSPLEEDETPEWLAELPEVPADEAMAIEEEPVIPDWLAVDETSTAERQGETPAEEEIPDWLAELPEAPVEEEAASPDEVEEETPDWLAELPEASAEEKDETFERAAEVTEDETPDWLKELPEVSTEEESLAPSGPAEAEELPDWLSDLPEAPDMPGEPAESPEAVTDENISLPAADEEEVETPDWLAELPTEFEEEEMPEGPVEETTAGEQPQWPEREAETDDPAATEPSELPEWMSDLRQLPPTESTSLPTLEEESVPPISEPSPPIEEEPPEVPEWLFQLEEVPPAESDSEMPDWLTELGETASAEKPPTSPQPETEETPEWLADVSDTPAEEPPPVKAEAEPTDWLAGFRPMPAEEEETLDRLEELPQEPPAEPTPAEAEELPPWLAEPDDETAEEPSTVSEEEEVPDWLASPPEAPVEEPPPADDQQEEEEEESADWLANMRQAIPFEEDERAPGEAAEPPERPVLPEEDETPPWLAEIAETTTGEPETRRPSPEERASPAPAEKQDELPEWLAELPEAAEEETSLPPAAPVEEADTPDWLADTAQSSVFFEETLADEEAVPGDETPAWLGDPPSTPEDADQPAASLEAEPAVTEEETAEDDDWLAELGGEEDLVLPDWLSEPPEGIAKSSEEKEAVETLETEEGESASPTDSSLVDEASEAGIEETKAEEPDLPGWLASATESTADETLISPAPEEKEDTPPESKRDSGEEKPPPFSGGPESREASRAEITDQAKTGDSPETAAGERAWRGIQPTVPEVEEDDSHIIESTGALTGLSGILPAQKIVSGAPVTQLGPVPLEGQKDAVLAAAREFHAIATAVPQPAALPAPITRRDRLIKGAIRTGLYLMFIIFIAWPLLPGLQKVTDPATGRRAPWTEPVGSLSEVLDRQRRELISTELGIIDFQQPDSVALVSFDFTPATQGELQPLAEAVLGRLRGQGMRLIFVSLQPEGAVLAQQTLQSLLDGESEEQYGDRIVNLGFLPGQITAIRELAAGRSFGTFTDYESDVPFSQIQSSGWADVQNMGQVDVVVNLTDNPTTARWWVEQMETAIEPEEDERYLVAATSVTADPFLRPYRASEQLDGLVSGINAAAAIEAGRRNFGPARQMLDSQSIAHLLVVILIAAGTMVGWMPATDQAPQKEAQSVEAGQPSGEKTSA